MKKMTSSHTAASAQTNVPTLATLFENKDIASLICAPFVRRDYKILNNLSQVNKSIRDSMDPEGQMEKSASVNRNRKRYYANLYHLATQTVLDTTRKQGKNMEKGFEFIDTDHGYSQQDLDHWTSANTFLHVLHSPTTTTQTKINYRNVGSSFMIISEFLFRSPVDVGPGKIVQIPGEDFSINTADFTNFTSENTLRKEGQIELAIYTIIRISNNYPDGGFVCRHMTIKSDLGTWDEVWETPRRQKVFKTRSELIEVLQSARTPDLPSSLPEEPVTINNRIPNAWNDPNDPLLNQLPDLWDRDYEVLVAAGHNGGEGPVAAGHNDGEDPVMADAEGSSTNPIMIEDNTDPVVVVVDDNTSSATIMFMDED